MVLFNAIAFYLVYLWTHSVHTVLQVTTLPKSNCIYNNSTVTISGFASNECSFSVKTSSHEYLFDITNVDLGGTDYLYMENLGEMATCNTGYAVLTLSEPTICKVLLPGTLGIHMGGQMTLEFKPKKNNLSLNALLCNNDEEDHWVNQTLGCPAFKEYSYIIKCKLDSESPNIVACKLSNPYSHNCTYTLKDRVVISTCLAPNKRPIYDTGFLIFPQNMSKTMHLELNNNSLTSFSIKQFPFSLGYLYLQDNAIETIQVGSFMGLVGLRYLFLRNNRLTALRNGSFNGLVELHTLHLKSNRLVTIESGVFQNFSSIVYINLHSNYLKLIPQGTFSGRVTLRYLNASNNFLRDLPTDLFQDLSNLISLDLANNNLNNLPLLRPMKQLKYLYLSNNTLYMISRDTFKDLPSTLEISVYQHEICMCYATCTCQSVKEKSPFLTCQRLLANIALACFTWVIGICALFGNMFVLWWRQMRKEQENKIQSLLLRNLAMSDLLMGVYMIIIASADAYFGVHFPMRSETWRTSASCKIAGVFAITSCEASLFFITLLSIDRFRCIRYPSSSSNYFTLKTWVVVCATWMAALILGIVPSVLSGQNPYFYDNSHVCIGLPLSGKIGHKDIKTNKPKPDKSLNPEILIHTTPTNQTPAMYYSSVIFLGLPLLCLLVVIACYSIIIRVVRKSRKQIRRDMKGQLYLTVRVTLIVATDFLSWFPIILTGILAQIKVPIPTMAFAWMVTFVLPLNSAINPFLYTLATVINNKRLKRNTKCKKQTNPVEMLVSNRQLECGEQGTKTQDTVISQRNGTQSDDTL